MNIEIIEYSPVSQFAIDSHHRIVHWNRASELLTGRSAREMLGTDRQWEPFYPERRPMLADLVVDHDREGMIRFYGNGKVARSKIIPNAWETEAFFENVGGQPRCLRFLAAPIYDREGNVSGAVETFLDITEQKNFEQALIQSEEGYRVLAENVPEGFALMQGGRYVLVNKAFAALFGYKSPDDLIGKKASGPIMPDYKDLFEKTIQDIETGQSGEKVLNWPCRTQDGKEIWVEGHPNLFMWENKPAVLTTIIDVTEIRAKEIAIKEEAQHLRKENIRLKSEIKDRYRFGDIVGKSPVMQEVYELILKAATTNASVIIYGESGTGKELVARAIHDMSDRREKEFVPVNCGAIPETLLESEFFGYKKGAFTGAHKDKGGFLDLAQGGTLFLDEVGELTLNIQVKLLRVIEGVGYTPVGSSQVKRSDARLVTATNRDLKEEVNKGLMRDDFFYRIHIIPIHLPPLRERREDIPLLADHFLHSLAKGKNMSSLPGRIMEALYNYHWPGNVRELQNALQRYLTVGQLDFIHSDDDSTIGARQGSGKTDKKIIEPLKNVITEVEKRMITSALNQTNWNRTKAAELLGIPRKALFRKMRRLEII
ncbi:MAG: sigma 54-interacting transcriptional regulator [Deltaproteobacteria bacterium]|nr:sigma 54-interacting transcriptional regulator [Deltaproteobacteria bacterium]